jgi:ribonuclease BN (tRNA processing enzyme)
MEIRQLENNKAALTNDGRLSILFIGVGSAFAARNFQTNLLIVKGTDHLQVDSGTKCSMALRQIGLSVPEIKNIHVTHSHADHVGGMESRSYRNTSAPTSEGLYHFEYEDMLLNHSLRAAADIAKRTAGSSCHSRTFSSPSPVNSTVTPATHTNSSRLDQRKNMRRAHPEDSVSWQDSV